MLDGLTAGYRLGERLPDCRDAEMWAATDPEGRAVTVTVIPCDKPAAGRAGFDRLAEVHHPGLASILASSWADGRCVVVSERPAGIDLASATAYGLPSASDLASWGTQAAEALTALHERGLVHGGLCPAVLVLDEEGDVTVTAAGVALAAAPLELGDRDPAENAATVSPEEVLATRLTPASDVYALAATLYLLATGRPPFEGPDALAVAEQHVGASVVPPRTLRPDLPAALDHVLRRALDKDPRRRPTAAAVAHDLERAALGARVEAPVVPEGPGARPRRPRWPWILGLVFVALLAGAMWGAGVFGGRVEVPDVTGLTESEAEATLHAVGLAPGHVTHELSADTTVPAGTVLGQTPAAGTVVHDGSSVDLKVAGGVVVPNVAGMTEARAREELLAAGLTVGEVTAAASATVPAGMVVDQFPQAGVTVASSTPVSLRVSAGPPPSASPSPSVPESPSPTFLP